MFYESDQVCLIEIHRLKKLFNFKIIHLWQKKIDLNN